MVVAAAREAFQMFDVLIVCGFAFEAQASGDTVTTGGELEILGVNMTRRSSSRNSIA
jgi:adenine-specific DNA-methyltransferase